LIDLCKQQRNREERPGGADQPPQFVPQSLPGFVRGKHIQIALIATKLVPIVAECETQEVHLRPRLVHAHHPCLLAVDNHPESAWIARRVADTPSSAAGLSGSVPEARSRPRSARVSLSPSGPVPQGRGRPSQTSADRCSPARARSLPPAAFPDPVWWSSCVPV